MSNIIFPLIPFSSSPLLSTLTHLYYQHPTTSRPRLCVGQDSDLDFASVSLRPRLCVSLTQTYGSTPGAGTGQAIFTDDVIHGTFEASGVLKSLLVLCIVLLIPLVLGCWCSNKFFSFFSFFFFNSTNCNWCLLRLQEIIPKPTATFQHIYLSNVDCQGQPRAALPSIIFLSSCNEL